MPANHAEKLFAKAAKKHKAGDHAAAIPLYKKILKQQHNHIDANYMLGTLYAETGKLNDALKYLKSAHTLQPSSQYINTNLGNVYRMMGEHAFAVDHYLAALRSDPNMVQACNNLAIVYRQLNDFDNAIECYQRAIALSPQFVEAHYNLGKLYLDLEQTDNARACFNRVIEINADHALAHNGLGDCCMQAGDTQHAIEYFNRYLKLSAGDDTGAALKLAYLQDSAAPSQHPGALVKQTYEKKAHTWDTDVGREDMAFLGPQHIRDAVAAQINSVNDSLFILDLGCGTGLCAPFLKPLARTLIGVDLSTHMLTQAQHKALYDELICDDIVHYLEITQARFDVMTASGVLIFFGDLRPVFSGIARALNDSGVFIGTCYRSDQKDVSVRANMHFAHSESYLRQAAAHRGLHVTLKDIVHEYDKGVVQPGYLVTLRK